MTPQQQPAQQRPIQQPWYRSDSSSIGNRAAQGALGAAGGALTGAMLAHGFGRSMGRGALLGTAVGAVGGALAGHRFNRWANQNPDQYNSMMNVANTINKFASSSPFKRHLTSIKQDAEKTALAHDGLHKLALGSTTVDRIIDPPTPGKYNRFLAPLAAAKYNNITAPLASAAADAGLSFIYGLTAPINTAKALPQLITSPELRFANRGASIVGSLAGVGTLGYGAYRAGKALMRRLQPVEQDAEKTVLAHYGLHKLASGPESNVHRDVGAYRFNRAAESNDIDDSRQYVFKAHDRRPQVTGDESGQGITFQEGVSG